MSTGDRPPGRRTWDNGSEPGGLVSLQPGRRGGGAASRGTGCRGDGQDEAWELHGHWNRLPGPGRQLAATVSRCHGPPWPGLLRPHDAPDPRKLGPAPDQEGTAVAFSRRPAVSGREPGIQSALRLAENFLSSLSASIMPLKQKIKLKKKI